MIGTGEKRFQPFFYLRERFGDSARFESRGIDGATSGYVLERLEADVLSRTPKPDTCVVLAGINDIQLGLPAEQIIANLQQIYGRLLAAGVRPVAVTIYPFGGYAAWTPAGEAARQRVRSWMHRWLPLEYPEVEVVDVEALVGDLSDPARPRMRADYVDHEGLHTNRAGGAAVATALVAHTRALGSLQG